MIDEDKKAEITEILTERGAVKPCPRCDNEQFALADGYFNQVIQKDLEGMSLGGPSIPSVAVVCTNCGYISQHALGVLGLLPSESTEEEEENNE